MLGAADGFVRGYAGAPNGSDFTAEFAVAPWSVIGLHLFYNHSCFDGDDPLAAAADDAAIVPGKHALRPGDPATAANLSGYSRGINGIMVDIDGLTGSPTASDFVFKMGDSANPSTWAQAPAPINDIAADVRPGAGVGGSDRVTIIHLG